MDAEAAAKAFQSYLDNAEAKSGKSIAAMKMAMKKSGLSKHSDLRAFAMEEFGLGHGHANAVALHFLKPDFKGSSSPPKKKTPAKKAAAKK